MVVQFAVNMQSINMLLLSAVLTLLLVVDCLAFSPRNKRQSVKDDDPECRPNPSASSGPPKPLQECCKIPEVLDLSVSACQSKMPQRGPPPPGGPPSGGPPSGGPPPPGSPPPDHEKMECFMECIFNSSGLLTSDNKLNNAAIVKVMEDFRSDKPEWSNSLSAVSAKCFDTSLYTGMENHECKSGAMRLLHCAKKQMFLNCPSSAWTSSDECKQIKAKVEKCPRMPIH